MSLRPGELLIDDDTPSDALFHDDGTGVKARGLVPRDYNAQPPGSIPGIREMKAVNVPLIPQSEWSDRIKELQAKKALLSDVRLRGNFGNTIPSLDQGQVGYCWAHDPTHAVMILRALANLPYVPLSAYAVAATIKNGADEGGWAALAVEFIQKYGVPAQQYWPQGDRNYRARNTPEMQQSAAQHKITQGWIDLAAPVYSRDLSFPQVMTLLLSGVPVCGDFNWWGHSVCLLDPVEVEPGSFGVRIWNSWSDSWGDRGMGVLRGDRAIPDGAVAPLATTASLA